MGKLEDFLSSAPSNWTLSIHGEDQARELAALTHALQGVFSETGDGKQISSGFSYWGIGPTIAWSRACSDPYYLVMKESDETFPERWVQTIPAIGRHKFNFVSLGVGTGDKDCHILRTLLRINPEILYFPIDMSPEMLRIGTQRVLENVKEINKSKVFPITLDISVQRNVERLQQLLNNLIGPSPIFYSLLGNTLANFEDDLGLLKLLTKYMKPDDLFLTEVAFTDSLEKSAQEQAASEYRQSNAFRIFVTSALLQNTDIKIDDASVLFQSTPEEDKSIKIKVIYQNSTNQQMDFTLPDRTKVAFLPKDTIRLYLTRKYTHKGLEDMYSRCELSLISKERSPFDYSQPTQSHIQANFGMELSLLSIKNHTLTTPLQSVFLSFGPADRDFAEKLNSALLENKVRTFFYLNDSNPGERPHSIMRKGVNEYDRVLLICSINSLDRPGVLNELDLVLARESREGGSNRLIPITLDRYLYDKWEPISKHLRTAVTDHAVLDFSNALKDDIIFSTVVAKLLKTLET